MLLQDLGTLAGQSNADSFLQQAIIDSLSQEGYAHAITQDNLGGQPITEWTNSQGVRGTMWPSYIQAIDDAFSAVPLAADRRSFTLFWSQGERQTIAFPNDATAGGYEAHFERFIVDSIRYVFNTYGMVMSVVLLETSYDTSHSNYLSSQDAPLAEVQRVQQAIAGKYPEVSLVSGAGQSREDEVHYDDYVTGSLSGSQYNIAQLMLPLIQRRITSEFAGVFGCNYDAPYWSPSNTSGTVLFDTGSLIYRILQTPAATDLAQDPSDTVNAPDQWLLPIAGVYEHDPDVSHLYQIGQIIRHSGVLYRVADRSSVTALQAAPSGSSAYNSI